MSGNRRARSQDLPLQGGSRGPGEFSASDEQEVTGTGYLRAHLGGRELKLVPTRANNQPALALYLPDPCTPIWRVSSLVVLTLRGSRVCLITRFGDRKVFARFGLPRTLPRD